MISNQIEKKWIDCTFHYICLDFKLQYIRYRLSYARDYVVYSESMVNRPFSCKSDT